MTPRHYAYLRISEGCSNACTFCSIPTFRGLFRSKPADTILAEARELVLAGARELNLISQDTTDWGRDLSGREKTGGLSWLLEELAAVGGVRWVRMLYAYPGHVSDELIATFARLVRTKQKGAVVPYLDMPIQHISSRMLKRMGRRHTREETCELLSKLRERVPGIVLRTTFISGFPGETLAEHEELVSFVREFRFERFGVFTYSHEKNTPAGEKFQDDIPPEEKKRRADELMATQQEIAFAQALDRVGEDIEVVVEAAGDESGTFVGRSVWDAPEIDPVVLLIAPRGAEIEPGTFLMARVTGANGYDLVARALEKGAPPTRARAAKPPQRRRLPLIPSADAARGDVRRPRPRSD
ncbi:MiaB/RimO family radical SAM methylthiotransferase [bacterium]|nr:MiaB/RimO family radical SAM methylthiotransferase [bacterium]